MVFENIVLSQDTLLIIGSYLFFTAILVYFYRFSNLKLMDKIKELKKKDTDLYKLIDKMNEIRAKEHREAKKRIEELEKHIDFLMKPEGAEKEYEREKILLRRR
ncbi:MAG TPA: hypothetical protein VFF13_03145 [archaeon]|nr:hypothetical protein [archaeon]